jgi:hypothetical protein
MDHILPLKVELLLAFGSAFFWTIAYMLIIYQGFRDKTCGMPIVALCANITWEFLFGFFMPFHPLQQIVTIVWFLLDCIILFQAFHYSRGLHAAWYRKPVVFALLVIFLLLHYGCAVEFHDYVGKYSAFGINLMMSLLFINMVNKQDLLGQSVYIGLSKLLGTLCASIWCYSMFPQSFLLNILYVLIFAADLIYILMLQNKSIRLIHKFNKQRTV